MSPSAEAVGLEPTSGFHPPPVFKTGSSSGRMASKDAHAECALVFGIRQCSAMKNCGGWNRTNAFLVQSQALLPAATTPQQQMTSVEIRMSKEARMTRSESRIAPTAGLTHS